MAHSKPVVKLSQDEKEAIEIMVSGPGWSEFLRVLDSLLRRRGEDVLTIEDDRLHKARAKFEGAKDLISDIRRLKELLKLSLEE